MSCRELKSKSGFDGRRSTESYTGIRKWSTAHFDGVKNGLWCSITDKCERGFRSNKASVIKFRIDQPI